MEDALVEIRRKLPAGEWTDIRPIDPGPTLMSGFKSLYAHATWMRGRAHSVFLKCIWAAGPGAGPHTQILTAPERLRGIEKRLIDVQKRQQMMPVVPILDVRIIDDSILVQTLESVTPVRSLVQTGQGNIQLALAILRDLAINYTNTEDAWIHLDICPANIGRRSNGRIVFIDVESCFLGASSGFPVSRILSKIHLQPEAILDSVVNEFRESGSRFVGVNSAVRKYEHEVALVAAEVSFGMPISFHGNPQCADEWVPDWLTEMEQTQPALSRFWRERLLSKTAIESGLNLLKVALDLEMLETTPPRAIAKSDQEMSAEPAEPKDNIQLYSADATVPEQTRTNGFDKAWPALFAKGAALRADGLDSIAITDYRSELLELVKSFPKESVIYKELLLIDIGFRRDPIGAAEVVALALAATDNDQHFLRMNEMIQQWVHAREAERGVQ